MTADLLARRVRLGLKAMACDDLEPGVFVHKTVVAVSCRRAPVSGRVGVRRSGRD
jgi:hypothetical protein